MGSREEREFLWSEEDKQEREREPSTIPLTNMGKQERDKGDRVALGRERQAREIEVERRTRPLGSREERERGSRAGDESIQIDWSSRLRSFSQSSLDP
jgi:hypothetical protein